MLQGVFVFELVERRVATAVFVIVCVTEVVLDMREVCE